MDAFINTELTLKGYLLILINAFEIGGNYAEYKDYDMP